MEVSELREKISGAEVSRLLKAAALIALLTVPLVLFTDIMVISGLFLATVLVAYLAAHLEMKWAGIELATFSTIIMGMSFGPLIGAVSGLLLIWGQVVAGQYVGMYTAWIIPGYIAAGAAAGLIGAASPVVTGVGIAVALHVLFSSFTFMFGRENLPNYLTYAVFNLAFNALLFTVLAPQVVAVLA